VPSMPYENQLVQPALAEDQSEGLDLMGFLRRRKSFIILLGILGVGVGYMMFQRQIPQYRSNAWVQVIHRNSDPRLKSMLAEKDLSDSDYVIKSPKTLSAAYQNHRLGELATLRGLSEEEAVALLAGVISTKSLSANVLDLFATGGDPGDMRQIVQAISEEYVAAQRGNYRDASEELKELLTRAREEFLEKLKTAEQDYAKFRETSSLNTDGDNPFRTRAKSAEQQVSVLELKKTELKAQLSQLEEAVNRGEAREAIMLMVGKGVTADAATSQAVAEASSSPRSIAQALYPLIEKASLLELELGPDHPRLKTVRLQIEMTRRHLQQLAGLDSGAQKDGETAPVDFLSVYLQSLREELLVLDRQLRDLQLMADQEDVKARELMQEEIEDSNRKNEMERLSKLFNETTMQISEVQVNAGMGGVTAQVLSPARHGVLVYPVVTQFIGMGGFLGAFVGLVLGYLVEVADRSFRKPEEMIREFGVPIVGHVPFITEDRMKSASADSPFDKTAVSIHLPRSRPAEAFRAVRTALCYSALGVSHRVLSVTSPAAGDGKSTLALNLAISLAQSGKRTILVEADLRRPKVHKLTGVSNDVGLVDVLRGDSELADAVQPTSLPEFFVLPCGKRPKDPAELLARPQFEQLLQVMREQYEYVIVDTPPVLAVTDPCGVAARVDGVIVCMRLSRHTRDLGRRTIEQLRDVGATLVGIVVNGVEERDAYGYGNYRYSDYRYYYKNYNYKYGYGNYGSKDGREYYADEHATEASLASSDTNMKLPT
jgi:succinoglycan biosynthesis transport protein ExoP